MTVERKNLCARIDPKIHEQHSFLARKNGKSLAEYTEEVLRKNIIQQSMEIHEDKIQLAVRKAVKETLTPSVERLASLSVKGSIMSATGVHLIMQSILDYVPDVDPEEIAVNYEEARKSAIKYMKNLE